MRFEAEEEPIAREIQQLIESNGVFQLEQLRLNKIAYRTPKYMSIFVRNM